METIKSYKKFNDLLNRKGFYIDREVIKEYNTNIVYKNNNGGIIVGMFDTAGGFIECTIIA